MQLVKRIVMCAAGGGKTTRIVSQALANRGSRSLLTTYTQNNAGELDRKLYAHGPVIPPEIEVMTWFTFLLRELARPYSPVLHNQRIEGFQWQQGQSAPYIPESNTSAHYFAGGKFIYSDKISKFICECERHTKGAVFRRLAQRFDHIFVDEIQDMAGYDLEVLELILKARINVTLVGDHRQATFHTNHGAKNKNFRGFDIIKKFQQWDKMGLASLSYEDVTHRCRQEIADLADSFFPNQPRTRSSQIKETGHDGVFTISDSTVHAYIAEFCPQVLRLDQRTNCHELPAMNFGESKGLTFDRVLIFPHVGGQKWLKTASIDHIEGSLAKMYVGATRARFSLAFVFDQVSKVPGIKFYPMASCR